MAQTTALPADILMHLRDTRSLPVISVAAIKFAVVVSKWATRRRTRLALSQLTPQQLDDVGLTPRTAFIESRRVFWRA
ncbi:MULTISPECIES: DUF1127 domain-containing protein [Roseobacteraceae]|jgi:uncharacterized protein YjiS (DUF1127 family)|uniref:YjiS-like domain-containing protein n=1 Tax=Pseudosulfitobacter pseudonitzschiae TaxID=1402135 RepID=A0A221K0E9_9RHOB|nr:MULTISPECIES: DUF1127 domain-containing protein [Roseobacteraceae]ASM72476.1 hypothetical protein SULPSESMR1_01663 [Pseudosulfitobacter pseudonitzschiae]